MCPESEAKQRFQAIQHTVHTASDEGMNADFAVVVDMLRQVQARRGSRLTVVGDDVGAAAVAAGLLFDFAVVSVVEPDPAALERSKVRLCVRWPALQNSRSATRPACCGRTWLCPPHPATPPSSIQRIVQAYRAVQRSKGALPSDVPAVTLERAGVAEASWHDSGTSYFHADDDDAWVPTGRRGW